MNDVKLEMEGLEELKNNLTDLQKKQIPYVTMLTINNIAFDFQKSLKKSIENKLKLERSATAIPNAVRVKKATKSQLYAQIYVNDYAWTYYALEQHFLGGDRHRKGMEKAMVEKGYMSKSEILTPPPGAKVKPSAYVKMMSQLHLNYKAGYDANETEKSKKRNMRKSLIRFFIVTKNSKSKMFPGIYANIPGNKKPTCILRISKRPNYKKKFDMEEILTKVYNRRKEKYWNEAWDRAISTAR